MTLIVSQLMNPPTCTFFGVSLPQVKCCEKVLMNELITLTEETVTLTIS